MFLYFVLSVLRRTGVDEPRRLLHVIIAFLANRKEEVSRVFILIVRHVRTLRTLPVRVVMGPKGTNCDPLAAVIARASLLE